MVHGQTWCAVWTPHITRSVRWGRTDGLYVHFMHHWKSDLKPATKWAAPCRRVGQSAARPPTGSLPPKWEAPGRVHLPRWQSAWLAVDERLAAPRPPPWSCWTSGCARCLSATGGKPSPTGACSSALACASPSWDPPSWTWGVRPSPPCSRSPGSSSPSSSSCWWAAAWEGSSRKRECG